MTPPWNASIYVTWNDLHSFWTALKDQNIFCSQTRRKKKYWWLFGGAQQEFFALFYWNQEKSTGKKNNYSLIDEMYNQLRCENQNNKRSIILHDKNSR